MNSKVHTIKLLDQSYELVPIDQLRPHEENPRRGSVPAIVASLEVNGFYGAVVAQRSSSRILVGNHRWEAAKNEGLKELPVFWLDVTDEQARRILLADNRTSDEATWDEGALAALLTQIHESAGTLEGTGYSEEAFDAIVQAANDAVLAATPVVEDEPPPPGQAAALQKKWKTKRGQIWQIPSATVKGKAHRLMCGDATDAADVKRLMGRKMADMVFIDPSYNVDYHGYTEERLKIANDSMPAEKVPRLSSGGFRLLPKRREVDCGNLRLPLIIVAAGISERARGRWLRSTLPNHLGEEHLRLGLWKIQIPTRANFFRPRRRGERCVVRR